VNIGLTTEWLCRLGCSQLQAA